MDIHTVADIAGDNQQHAITLSQPARWVQIVVAGAGTVRLGDSTADASHGLPIPAGSGQMLPALPYAHHMYLKFYLYVPNGATASVCFGA